MVTGEAVAGQRRPITPGMLVWWIHRPRGGYCMPERVPGLVEKLGKTRVSIWAATRFVSSWAKQVQVEPANLRVRAPDEPWKGLA